MHKWETLQPTAFLSDVPLDSFFSFSTLRGVHAEVFRDLGSQETRSSVFLRSKDKNTQAVTLDNKIVPKRTGRRKCLKRTKDLLGYEKTTNQWGTSLSLPLSLCFDRVSLCSPGWSQTCDPLCNSLLLGWQTYSFVGATMLSMVAGKKNKI